MKFSLEKSTGKFEQPEERISKLEHRIMEIIRSEKQGKKEKIEEKQTEPKRPVGTPSKGLTYTSWESQKGKIETKGQREYGKE